MFNVIKNALLYTAVYAVIVHVVFWTVFFVMITVQVFWKVFAMAFLVLLAFMTFDYVKAQGGVKNLFSNYKVPANWIPAA